jgi:tetratricopeptide (TPR) repeat protein
MLLPALALYLGILARTLRSGWLVAVAALYIIAMLTKIEAVAFFAVVGAAEVLLAPGLRDRPLRKRLPSRGGLIRLGLVGILTISYLFLWHAMSPLAGSSGKASVDMTPGLYLLTQVRAWWYYIGEFLAPVRLVFDEAAYPISGAVADSSEPGAGASALVRAVLDPRVWFAVSGWILAAGVGLQLVRRAPLVPFLLVSYIALLSPSSSVVPLAEMVNDHRPYLPMAGLYILAVCGLWLLLRALTARPALAFALISLALGVPYLGLTHHRNAVFHDDLSLYADTVSKSPDSARAQMQYGLALMHRRRNAEAEAHFRRSVALWPYWHYGHTNLAIVLAEEGKMDAAAAEHDEAVRCGSSEWSPYYWRGRFRATRGETDGAIADFEKAVSLNASAFNEAAALAAALARAGRSAEAQAVTDKYARVNPAGFAAVQSQIASLFPRVDEAVSLNDRAIGLMGQARYTEALDLLNQSLRINPGNHFVHSNIAIVRAAQGDEAGSLAEHNEAVRLAPEDPSPYYWRARLYLKQGDYGRAILDLRAAAERSHQNIHETAPLVECLLRAGRMAEAQPILDQAQRAGQSGAMENERAAFRSAVFGER